VNGQALRVRPSTEAAGPLPLAVVGLKAHFVECGATHDLATAALMVRLCEGLPTNLDFLSE
jgi:hypothetical protein